MARWTLLAAASLALLAGCAAPVPARKAPPAAARAPANPTERAAQKRAYDRGVVFFGEERYAEARRSWLEALKLGPGSELGRKAQEGLNRVASILKSLAEIERQ